MKNLRLIDEFSAGCHYRGYELASGRILLVEDAREPIYLGDSDSYWSYRSRLCEAGGSGDEGETRGELRWVEEFTRDRFYEVYEMSTGNVLVVDDGGGVITLKNRKAYAFYRESLSGAPIPSSHAPYSWLNEAAHDVELIALDLGDTLETDKAILPEVKQVLAGLVREGVKIATASVAPCEYQVELFERWGFGRCAGFPHFISGDMRELYYLTASGYVPDVDHNERMRLAWREVLPRAREILNRELERLRTAGISVRREGFDEERRGIVGLLFADLESAKTEARLLERTLSDEEGLACNRHARLIQMVHSRAGKGNTLRTLAERESIPFARVLCLGDTAVDLCMLDGRHGFLSATVANAEDVVQDAVRAWGGPIASKPRGRGVVELLEQLRLPGSGEEGDGP